MIPLFSKLFRPRLALVNGVTALGGYCLFPAPVKGALLLAALCAVTLLAMGGSALNQLLERDLDAVMSRTMSRPLPQGRLSAAMVFLLGIGTLLAGLLLLAASGGYLPVMFGGFALIWYLAVYTPLKRRTPLALPLGALCGAFPPLIGWCLAGGTPTDSRIVVLAGLLFLWQIPHFWLLQERHAADYRRAGIPLVNFHATLAAPIPLLLLWVAALAVATLLLPLMGGMNRYITPGFPLIALILPLLVMQRFKHLLFPAFSLFPVAITVLLLWNRIA
jgi:protoheme IX farnesyltransferase